MLRESIKQVDQAVVFRALSTDVNEMFALCFLREQVPLLQQAIKKDNDDLKELLERQE